MPRNAMIRSIYSFVNIRKLLIYLIPKKVVSQIKLLLFKNDKKPKLADKTRKLFNKHFENDINELSGLLNKDFSKWIK